MAANITLFTARRNSADSKVFDWKIVHKIYVCSIFEKIDYGFRIKQANNELYELLNDRGDGQQLKMKWKGNVSAG